MDVIERLREAVKESGYQRKKVAERAGMKPAKLTKILSGRQAVTVGDFMAIAQAIDRDPSHLISDKDVVVELGALQSAHRAAQEIERILDSLLPKPAAFRIAGRAVFTMDS